MAADEAPYIQSLLVANEVKLVNGLLHVSGGGWRTLNRVFPPDYVFLPGSSPPQSPLGIAVIVAVRWHQSTRPYKLIVEICDEDGKHIGDITAQVIEEGRPSGIPPGSMHYQTFVMQMGFPFPNAGGYEVVARIEGIEDSARRWIFEVRDVTSK